jgi:hypothetical protein
MIQMTWPKTVSRAERVSETVRSAASIGSPMLEEPMPALKFLVTQAADVACYVSTRHLCEPALYFV